MTDAINWHPLGTPGPWKKVETPDYAEIHNEVNATPVALVGISTTDARAIAEVPAMVVALRELADDLESELQSRYAPELVVKYADIKRRFDRDMAPVAKARAILSRIDGGAA